MKLKLDKEEIEIVVVDPKTLKQPEQVEPEVGL